MDGYQQLGNFEHCIYTECWETQPRGFNLFNINIQLYQLSYWHKLLICVSPSDYKPFKPNGISQSY